MDTDESFMWGVTNVSGIYDGYRNRGKMEFKQKVNSDYVQRKPIEGAAKFGKYWVIPVDAEKTLEHRITSGQYKTGEIRL